MIAVSPCSPASVRAQLESMGEESYRAFQSKLIPTIAPSLILGVRLPALRAFAGKIKDPSAFLSDLPHRYLEENLLHGILIARKTDFSSALESLKAFLPHIDNWAVCDLPPSKELGTDLPALRGEIETFLVSDHPYTVRYGIALLMRFYLGENEREEALKRVCKIRSAHYYVNMMAGWFFATALSTCPEDALPYVSPDRLCPEVFAIAARKARESRLVSEQIKMQLAALRR